MEYKEINNVPLITMDNVFNEQQLDTLDTLTSLVQGEKVDLSEIFNMATAEELPFMKTIRDLHNLLQTTCISYHPCFRGFADCTKPIISVSRFREETQTPSNLLILVLMEDCDVTVEGQSVQLRRNGVLVLPGYAICGVSGERISIGLNPL